MPTRILARRAEQHLAAEFGFGFARVSEAYNGQSESREEGATHGVEFISTYRIRKLTPFDLLYQVTIPLSHSHRRNGKISFSVCSNPTLAADP